MLHEALSGHPMPVAGGVYDQHPVLIDQWFHILGVKSKYEKEEHRKSKRK